MLGLIQWGADRGISVQYLTAWGGVSPNHAKHLQENHRKIGRLENSNKPTPEFLERLASDSIQVRMSGMDPKEAVAPINVERNDTGFTVLQKAKEAFGQLEIFNYYLLFNGKMMTVLSKNFVDWLHQARIQMDMNEIFDKPRLMVIAEQSASSRLSSDSLLGLNVEKYADKLLEIVTTHMDTLGPYINDFLIPLGVTGFGNSVLSRKDVDINDLSKILGIRAIVHWGQGYITAMRSTSIKKIYDHTEKYFSKFPSYFKEIKTYTLDLLSFFSKYRELEFLVKRKDPYLLLRDYSSLKFLQDFYSEYKDILNQDVINIRPPVGKIVEDIVQEYLDDLKGTFTEEFEEKVFEEYLEEINEGNVENILEEWHEKGLLKEIIWKIQPAWMKILNLDKGKYNIGKGPLKERIKNAIEKIMNLKVSSSRQIH